MFILNQQVDRSRINNFYFYASGQNFDNDHFGKQDTQIQLRSYTPDVHVGKWRRVWRYQRVIRIVYRRRTENTMAKRTRGSVDWACVTHISFCFEENKYRTFHWCFPPNFGSFWQSSFREEDFKKSTNQKQELPVVAMFVKGSERNEQSQQRTFHRCFLPGFGTFGQMVSEGKNLKQPIRNKNCLWLLCLLMDWDKMSSLYRGPPIDASYQVSAHLSKRFQRRFFF
jgi:hypothetical protein